MKTHRKGNSEIVHSSEKSRGPFIVTNHRRNILPLLGERAGVRENRPNKNNIRFTESFAVLQTQNEGGFVATFMFIGLLAIMLMLAVAGGMALIHLHDEVKVLERQQIKRLNVSATNSVAIAHISFARSDKK